MPELRESPHEVGFIIPFFRARNKSQICDFSQSHRVSGQRKARTQTWRCPLQGHRHVPQPKSSIMLLGRISYNSVKS